MKLTKKKAIEITIELWTFGVETGKGKRDWDGWGKYGKMDNDCPLCEYILRIKSNCEDCPYLQKFYHCIGSSGRLSIYEKWCNAKTPKTRKKYAKLFLGQLKQL